jgi:hypothetical protein
MTADVLRGTLRTAQLLIGGQWTQGIDRFAVLYKCNGETIAHCERASKEQVDEAVAAARRSFEEKKLTPYERYEILMRASELILERGDLLAETIVAEAGFLHRRRERGPACRSTSSSAEEGRRSSAKSCRSKAPGNAHRWRHDSGSAWRCLRYHLVQLALNMVAHKVAPRRGREHRGQATAGHSARAAPRLRQPAAARPHQSRAGPGSEVGGWLVANPDISLHSPAAHRWESSFATPSG